MKYALFDYIPRRRTCKASFDQQDIGRMVLGFKDGRNLYTRWAVREFSKALVCNDLRDVVIVCVPASTHYSHVRRWKRFSSMLCKATGAIDGFGRVQVSVRTRLRGSAFPFVIDFLLEDGQVNSVITVEVVADGFKSGLLHIDCLSGFRGFPSLFLILLYQILRGKSS